MPGLQGCSSRGGPEMNDIEESWYSVHQNLLWIIIPPTLLSWLLFGFLFMMDTFFLIVVLVVFILTAKMAQLTFFVADRWVCTAVGYSKMQEYFHLHYEENTRLLRLKTKALYWYGFHPFFRCRASTLGKWYHSTGGKY